jgi:dTDP-4-dehydrorhamnose reductase
MRSQIDFHATNGDLVAPLEPVHLVFGANGQLGFQLVRVLARRGTVVALSRPEVDFLRPPTLVAALQQHRPTVVWNAAAATGVDALESDPDLAYRINAEAVGVLADVSRRQGAVLVHFSTDYVFDGTKSGAYSENDAPNPLNVYGKSKLAGEEAVRQAGGRWFVLRTSWLYAIRGRNFLRTIVQKGTESEQLRIVNDQVGAPTEASQLACACDALYSTLGEDAKAPDLGGIYHVTATGTTSWWGFACAIRDELSARGMPWKATIEPITSHELNLPVRRPANSCLNTDLFTTTFGLRMLPWREALARVLSQSETGVVKPC